MGHVVFAAPPIARLRLVEAVQRALLLRGHRVTVTVHDPVARRCFEAQAIPAHEILPTGGAAPVDPAELTAAAERDRTLAGRDGPARRGEIVALRRRAAGFARWCDREVPDLAVLCDDRSGLARLIATVARGRGADVLHLGTGPLPGLLQRDDFGIDGDAATASRPALSYRDVRADRRFLQSALAALLAAEADAGAPGLAVGADWYDRLGGLVAAACRGRLAEGLRQIAAWRAARAATRAAPPGELEAFPATPHLLVLLEADDSPRVRIDGDGVPAAALLTAARDAAAAVLPGAHAVAAGPPTAAAACAAAGVALLPERAALPLIATAVAVVTVTHPAAAFGLLTETPVCHLGRTAWSVPGATRRTTLETLRDDLRLALGTPATHLRERAATRLFRDDHLWCDPTRPDPNGVRGVVEEIERRLCARLPVVAERPYRPGPAWPLSPGSA